MIKKWLPIGAPLLLLLILAGGLYRVPTPEPASASEMAEVGIGYYKTGKLVDARTVLEKVLKDNPEHFRARYGLGLVELEARNVGLAERHLKKALSLKPDDVEVAVSLGAVYQRGKAYDQAEKVYLEILRVKPNHSKTLYNLARLNIAKGNLSEGRDLLKKYMASGINTGEKMRAANMLEKVENRLKDKSKK